MRSFGIFSLVATAALSLFASAAPAPGGPVKVDVAAAAKVHALRQRDTELRSVPVILTGLIVELTPTCNELREWSIFMGLVNFLTKCIEYITKDNCTSEVLTPHFNKMVSCISSATAEIKLLVGADLSVILAGVDATVQVTVAAVAELLCSVLHVGILC